MKATSLVTGVAGFIGAHLGVELQRRGHYVVGLDDLSGGFRQNVPSEIHFIEGSVNDSNLVSRLFEQYEIQFVFHLAAYAAEGLSHFVRGFNYQNNLLGSINLINASVNAGTVKCFSFTSSIAVYGNAPGFIAEDAVPRPIDPYGVSKYAVELDLQAAREMFGLPFVVFRLHNVYGEGQNIGDPYRNVVGIFMKQIMEGKELTIFGDGSQTRSFTYISDVVRAIAASIERPSAYNQIFNMGSDQSCSILELAKMVSQVMDVELKLKFLPARHEPKHLSCSHVKAQKNFGDLIDSIDLASGLQRMADWAKRVGVRRTTSVQAFEIQKHLPDCWRQVADR